MTISDTSNHIDENQELWYLEDFDQDSISSHKLELDQPFDYECEPDPQLCDLVSIFEFMLTPVFLPNLDQFPEPIFIPVPINLEIESPIMDSHIPLMGKECEYQFLELDSTLEPKLTLESKVNFPELDWFLNLSFLSPSQPFHQVTFFCWT